MSGFCHPTLQKSFLICLTDDGNRFIKLLKRHFDIFVWTIALSLRGTIAGLSYDGKIVTAESRPTMSSQACLAIGATKSLARQSRTKGAGLPVY